MTAFTCVHCGWTSHNVDDEINRYCGHCHHYCDDVRTQPQADGQAIAWYDLVFGEDGRVGHRWEQP